MGCEYCEKWNNENKECTANYAYRYYSCGVNIGENKKGSNYTPPKKKRKKNKKH